LCKGWIAPTRVLHSPKKSPYGGCLPSARKSLVTQFPPSKKMIYTVGVQGCPKGESSKFKPNRNGAWPVILKSVNGVPLPQNSDILDGSVAESMGVIIGSTYMLMIVEKDPYVHTDGKVYKKYDYTVIGGNASQQIATELAKDVIGDIAKLIARPSASPSASASPSVLTQPPVINADEPIETENEEMTEEQMQAEFDKLKKALKAKTDAKKKLASKEPASSADVPF